jgi:hypothetical protein
MKKIIFSSIILLILSLVFFRCNIEPPPHVTDVQYNAGNIDITLSADNRLPTSEVETKITITEDSFNGTAIDFTVTGAVPGTSYSLNPASALQSGHDYYITFEEGAFGTSGTGTGITGESLPGSYVVSVP